MVTPDRNERQLLTAEAASIRKRYKLLKADNPADTHDMQTLRSRYYEIDKLLSSCGDVLPADSAIRSTGDKLQLATENFLSLPGKLFVISPDGENFIARRESGGKVCVFVWTDRDLAEKWLKSDGLSEFPNVTELRTDKLAVMLIQRPVAAIQIDYLVVDPVYDDARVPADSFALSDITASRLTRLETEDLWEAAQAVLSPGGFPDFLKSFVLDLRQKHPEKTLTWALEAAGKSMNRFSSEFMSHLGVPPETISFLKYMRKKYPKATTGKVIELAVEAIKICSSDFMTWPGFSETNAGQKLLNWIKPFSPPGPCVRCGELEFTLDSISPTQKSAKWHCSYCEKTFFVTSSAESDKSTRISRTLIPELIRHEVWRRDNARCVECDSQERLEFDHIIPISQGGANTARNIQLLCENCNRRKSDRV